MEIREILEIKKYQRNGNKVEFDLFSPITVNFQGVSRQIKKINITGRASPNFLGKEIKEGSGRAIIIENDLSSRVGWMDVSDDGTLMITKGEVRIRKSYTNDKKGNQVRVIDWINDNFSLSLDYDGVFRSKCQDERPAISKNQVEDINAIFQVIKRYIENNKDKFYLSKKILFNREGLGNLWWSQEIPEGDPRNLFLITYNRRGINISGTRKIMHGNNDNVGRSIDFCFFTPQQYEELKNSLSNNISCKVAGCYNNHADTLNYHQNQEIQVRNGICNYHRRAQQNKEDENRHNTKVINFYVNDDSILLINQIFNKAKEEEEGFCTFDEPMLPQKIETSDSYEEKVSKKKYFENKLDKINNIIIKKRREVIKLIEELLRKQDEYINQNTNANKIFDNNQNIHEFRKRAIQTIHDALNSQNPKITNEELETDNRNWREKINKESNGEKEIKNVLNSVLADIRDKRIIKFNTDKLEKLIKEAKKTNNYGELVKKIKQIESFRGQKGYNVFQTEINTLETRLIELSSSDPEKYRQEIINLINEILLKKSVKEHELSEEIKNNLKKLKNKVIKEPEKIRQIKEQTINEINLKSSEKRLEKLLREYNNCTDYQTKNEIKRKINSFIFSDNVFHRQSYQNRKDEVNKILGIKNEEQQNTSDKNKILILLAICFSIFIFIFALALIIRRKRKVK